jgi:uncharacterized membrane protein YuzA (DUF378 family)
MSSLNLVAWILVVVGAINWGLVGLSILMGGTGTDWNVVNMIASAIGGSQIEAIIYVLVGVAGVWMVIKKAKM